MKRLFINPFRWADRGMQPAPASENVAEPLPVISPRLVTRKKTLFASPADRLEPVHCVSRAGSRGQSAGHAFGNSFAQS